MKKLIKKADTRTINICKVVCSCRCSSPKITGDFLDSYFAITA
ncbi:hypothetical protein PV797_04320 [Clostridiaceae bacterium M8S5]|nr:hypothetical protein PV797_04320 [Clostridiaceae bacterium M8S5]